MGCARLVEWPALNPEGALRVNARVSNRLMRGRLAPQCARIAFVAIFRVLCTRQYSCNCVLTLALPRKVKRLMRLWWRMLANVGSTVAMRQRQSDKRQD
jgi:hypothetical protein